MANDICKDLIQGRCRIRKPMIDRMFGNIWKGKADIVNHEEKLVIDLKTTADIHKFNGQHLNITMTHKLTYIVSYLDMSFCL